MEIQVGSVVRSIAGHDMQSLLIVVGYENGMAYCADGRLRRVDSPKKKKLKHLQKFNYVSPRIAKLVKDGAAITNSEVRKALAEYQHIE